MAEIVAANPKQEAGRGALSAAFHVDGLRELDQPPVLIGHSYGGLFVELLLDR